MHEDVPMPLPAGRLLTMAETAEYCGLRGDSFVTNCGSLDCGKKI